MPRSGPRQHPWRLAKRDLVDDCWQLDSAALQTGGVLKAGAGRIRLQTDNRILEVGVQVKDDSLLLWHWPLQAAYRIRLSGIPSGLGKGIVHFILCPLGRSEQPCNKRCRKLFLPQQGGAMFGCRTCRNLTDRSSQEQHRARSWMSSFRGLAGLDIGSLALDLDGWN